MLVIVVVVAVIAGAIGGVIAAAGGGGKEAATGGGGGGKPSGTGGAVPASTDGVTSKSVTIVFPVIDLSAAGRAVGLQGLSDEKDPAGIRTYVKEINDAGGIHGRKINARIEKFNPLEPADMRAKCKDWTTSGDVFAVVDTGKWYDQQQLCITQEGHMPLISEWTTVTDWIERGKPYLWWTGPDQADIIRNLVPWGIEHGLLAPGKKFAVIAGDRAGDKLAVDKYLLPALSAKGLTPAVVDTITANIDDPSTARSQANSTVTKLKSEGVETVIPLLPINSFQAYLASAESQKYAPRLMLSDYELSVQNALGLAEFQYPDLLSGQIGPTVYTLGSEDDDRPNGLAGDGYIPTAKACWVTWHKDHKKPPYIEAQGPTMRWCESIHLLARALDLAGRNLNRRTFIDALGKIQNFDAPLTPVLSFSPDKHAGPVEYRTLRPVKNGNTAETNKCPPRRQGDFHGSCWQVVEDWKPLETGT